MLQAIQELNTNIILLLAKLEKKKKESSKEVPPVKKGQHWYEEEVNQLLKEIEEKKSDGEIAIFHQRTEGGIKARKSLLAKKFFSEGERDLDELAVRCGLNRSDLLIVNEPNGEIHLSINNSLFSNGFRRQMKIGGK